MVRNSKGSRRERELLSLFSKNGFVVHRVAGSGKGEDAICDLIAIDKNGKVSLIEVKSRKNVYYTKDDISQLNELINYAKKCNSKPILAVKLNYKDWQFFDLTKGIPEKVE
ncbi:MAG: Holliday junction resolvase Hjc [Candidatus Aenigmatarchaeota archaeon]|nr:hypothetical protein [Candidatus Aenigmarchaeota archaeon]